METIYQAFLKTAAKYPDNEAVAAFKGGVWQPISYRELERAVKELAAGFASSGLSAGERVAFMIDNSPEYEQVRVFTLLAEPFTQENDLLTPTLKLKRPAILKRRLAPKTV